MEYVYLIREREFIRLGEPTYKLGKTKRTPSDRMKGYSKDSEVVLFINVEDCDITEKKMIAEFKKKFTIKSQYGREYFQGCPKEMMLCIFEIVNNQIAITIKDIYLQLEECNGVRVFNNKIIVDYSETCSSDDESESSIIYTPDNMGKNQFALLRQECLIKRAINLKKLEAIYGSDVYSETPYMKSNFMLLGGEHGDLFRRVILYPFDDIDDYDSSEGEFV